MTASAANPIYSAYIVSNGKKYNVTPVLTELKMAESRQQIAQSVDLHIANVKVDGTWLSGIFRARDRVFVYANDGTKNEEVFRGYVWKRGYSSSLAVREITLRCYDHLMYLQESEASEFFESGKTTKSIIAAIASEWGLSYTYNYESITHTKLALRGGLADILTSDILDLVKDRKGKNYVILSDKDTMHIRGVGQNQTVYKIVAGQNAVKTSTVNTLEGVITKVVILGKANKEDRRPVEATITKNTDRYGTIQKIIDRDEDTTLADAQADANNLLKKNSSPKWEYELEAPDIPWIRKGDKVYVNAGDISNRYLIVTDIDRTISNSAKKMTLGLKEESDLT